MASLRITFAERMDHRRDNRLEKWPRICTTMRQLEAIYETLKRLEDGFVELRLECAGARRHWLMRA